MGFTYSFVLSKTRWQRGLRVLNDFCTYEVFQYWHHSYSMAKAICCLILSCVRIALPYSCKICNMCQWIHFFSHSSGNEEKERWIPWATAVCWCLQVFPGVVFPEHTIWRLCIENWCEFKGGLSRLSTLQLSMLSRTEMKWILQDVSNMLNFILNFQIASIRSSGRCPCLRQWGWN